MFNGLNTHQTGQSDSIAVGLRTSAGLPIERLFYRCACA